MCINARTSRQEECDSKCVSRWEVVLPEGLATQYSIKVRLISSQSEAYIHIALINYKEHTMHDEELKERARKVVEELFSGSLKPQVFTQPKGLCKVCGEERVEDLLYHGAGKGALIYLPCRHSVHFANGQPEVWEDSEGNEVEIK